MIRRELQVAIVFALISAAAIPWSPASEPPDPVLTRLHVDLLQLFERYYPGVTSRLHEGAIDFAYDTRLFLIHVPLKTGEWQEAREVEGPNRHGVLCRIMLQEGPYNGAAVLPQTVNDRYFETLVLALDSPDRAAHLHVWLSYPEGVDKAFLKAFRGKVDRAWSAEPAAAEQEHEAASVLLAVAFVTGATSAATSSDVQARVDADIAEGKPIVVHVVVALCDNVNQGIVPVPEALGNGQDPGANLYWGALYGVRTYLPRSANWTKLHLGRPDDRRILERIVLYTEIDRNQRGVPVYIVADAWDGAEIREATLAYLEMTAGRSIESVEVKQEQETLALGAGGDSHLVVYVGHNGLMDFSLEAPAPPEKKSPARSAMALACASKSYFVDHLRSAGAHPLLLTTGLMAPEAYTLDSAIRSWIADGTTAAVTAGAAGAYDRYQKCGLSAAQRLFWGQP